MTTASWTDEIDEYRRIARESSDVIRLTTKDHWFWRRVAGGLFLLSFGRFDRRRFLEQFATTLGPVQAYPRQWASISETLVVHESRHIQQFLFAGWFVPLIGWLGRRVRVWCGLLPMSFVYGLFPLPIFFAWGRFRLELDADSFSWRVALHRGWLSPQDVRERAEWFAKQVAGWAYLKSWPEPWTVAAFRKRAEKVIRQWEDDCDRGAQS